MGSVLVLGLSFTALFVVAHSFLLCALLRRIRRPNPLVDLP
jgi:hypothetical protein